MARIGSFRRLMLLVLAGWALEALNYTALIEARHAGAAGVGFAEMYVRVFLIGLPADFARLLLFMAALWLSAWIVDRRVDGKLCLEAAGYASLVTGIVLAGLAPFAGVDGFTRFVNVSLATSIAAGALGLAWGLTELGVRMETWRLVAASVFASMLLYLGPGVFVTPQSRFYATVYSILVHKG